MFLLSGILCLSPGKPPILLCIRSHLKRSRLTWCDVVFQSRMMRPIFVLCPILTRLLSHRLSSFLQCALKRNEKQDLLFCTLYLLATFSSHQIFWLPDGCCLLLLTPFCNLEAVSKLEQVLLLKYQRYC